MEKKVKMRHKKSAKNGVSTQNWHLTYCKRNNKARKIFNIPNWNGYCEKTEMHGFQMAIIGTAKSDLKTRNQRPIGPVSLTRVLRIY